MLLIVLSICLALSNGATIPKILDDELEQSGDFEIGITSIKTEQPDSSATSNESDITKAFANHQLNKQQQQQQQQQQRQQPPQTKSSNGSARPQSKSKQTRPDLSDDINDFIDLIPKAEVKAKLEEYYRNDMDVQHIFEYMHGKEFIELRKAIVEVSDVKDTLQYLNKNGLNIKSILRKLDNRLGVSKIRSSQFGYSSPQPFGTNTTIGGINGLVEDVLALLPQDEIFILFFEKLDSSPKFTAFVQSIGDPSFHRKYTTLWKSKDLYTASAQLKKHKIDIVKIIQIIQRFFIFGTF